MKYSKGSYRENLEINMTPMIDICFQLIIFFMLSLRLFSAEGDFSIQMPLTAPQEGLPDEAQTPPMKIRLRADRKGKLAGMQMGQRAIATFKDLQRQVREIAGLDRGPSATPANSEVELDCDYNLRYEYVVDVLTAVSGFVADDKKTIVRMVEKIKFAPPRKPGEPGKPIKRIKSSEAGEPSGTIKVIKPGEAIKLSEPIKPIKSSEPSKPSE
jgi:biopolymer transport protein ExbD